MTTPMHGLAFLGDGQVGLVEREIPKAGPDEVIAKTTASMFRTSDVGNPRRFLKGRVVCPHPGITQTTSST